MNKNRLNQLRKVESLLGIEVEWRECYGSRALQEAYINGLKIRGRLTKILGEPQVVMGDDQKFWDYTLSGKLRALGVKELYVEKYKDNSFFLCVRFVR